MSSELTDLCQTAQDLAAVEVARCFGPINALDVRHAFLVGLKYGQLMNEAQINTVTRLMLGKLGVTGEEYLACYGEELSVVLAQAREPKTDGATLHVDDGEPK